MRILLLAPHPFYRDRGTPIADLQMLKALSERKNTFVDCLVFHTGADIKLPNVRIHRIPNIRFIKKIGIGFSAKKIVCDFFFFFKALRMIRRYKYDIIHAVEESVFFAMLFKRWFKLPYIYDLDSSLAQQLIEKVPALKIFSFFFNWMETKAIQGAQINLPVCLALMELCKERNSKKTIMVPDISLLENDKIKPSGFLKEELNIKNKKIILYVGNLESYQGIDLLLESFNLVCQRTDQIDLVIIGGSDKRRKFYIAKSISLKVETRTHFLNPIPLNQLEKYLIEADIVVSPRIRGNNTPMKIFPFLGSGKPVLATDIYTHNQLLTHGEAFLAAPNPTAFSEAIIDLLKDKCLRKKIGEKGKKFIEENFTYSAHKDRVFEIYDWIEYNGRHVRKNLSKLAFKILSISVFFFYYNPYILQF